MKKAVLILALLSILMLAALSGKEKSALESIEISPNPMTKYTDITLVFNQNTYINVTIENDMGEVVKNLYSGQAEEYLVLGWNRISDKGTYVPSGEYFVVVGQGRYTSTKKTLILK